MAHLANHMISLIGVPHDYNSSHLRGCAHGPAAVRRVMHSGASNWCAENGRDLAAEALLHDHGDLPLTNDAAGYETIYPAYCSLLEKEENGRLLTLGGDHAIAYPTIRAHAEKYTGLTVLQLDAHPDLYDNFEGNRFSHACPFARLMETGLIKRLVQVGIRTLNPHQRAQAERLGVEIIPMRDWTPATPLHLEGPLYLSLDLDVLDPACAPGISHHEPGGMTMRDLLTLIQGLDGLLVGAEIVELNPTRDVQEQTAAVAFKLLKEIAAVMG